jgi:hypothetical protein
MRHVYVLHLGWTHVASPADTVLPTNGRTNLAYKIYLLKFFITKIDIGVRS